MRTLFRGCVSQKRMTGRGILFALFVVGCVLFAPINAQADMMRYTETERMECSGSFFADTAPQLPEKIIYLTFDDGPGPYTLQLLDILDQYGVKATFFVTDSGYDDVMRQIVNRGHSIGIHTMSHDYGYIYASQEYFFQDLLGMQDIIYKNTGVQTYLMRFPGGSSNTVSCFNPGVMTRLSEAVARSGFCYFDWNVDSNDAGGAVSSDEVYSNIISGLCGQRVSIVLQHDIHAFSVNAVERVLIWGSEHGYTFLPLDMTSPTLHHGINN